MAADGKGRKTGRFLWHGTVGLSIIILAEALLLTGNEVIGRWFTPIVWTGYLLFVDALVYRLKGRSLLVTERVEFILIALVSVAGWWLFEFYNAPRFWRSDLELWWHYHNLEPNPYLRRVGYDWAFATIFPAMFETAELLAATIFRVRPLGPRLRLPTVGLHLLIVMGAAAALVPLVRVNEWFVPLVWLAFIFLLDPLNALRGWPSVTADLARGDWRRLAALLAAGGICGVLWEFWNYWAISRWTYTVPYLGNVKIFEMPVLGYLGFPPFAVECWAIYVFVRSLLGGRVVRELEEPEIWLTPKEEIRG